MKLFFKKKNIIFRYENMKTKAGVFLLDECAENKRKIHVKQHRNPYRKNLCYPDSFKTKETIESQKYQIYGKFLSIKIVLKLFSCHSSLSQPGELKNKTKTVA